MEDTVMQIRVSSAKEAMVLWLACLSYVRYEDEKQDGITQSSELMGIVDGLYIVSQEDLDGGFPNGNYLRFGRSNYDDYDNNGNEELTNSVEKRSRNFLRFGRDSSRNFLRFGHDPSRNFLRFGRDPSRNFLRFGRDPSRNFLRFGRDPSRNFLRFGRDPSRNFLRFGRSVICQLSSQPQDGCGVKSKFLENISEQVQQNPSSSNNINSLESGKITSQRWKRAVPGVYYSPSAWARNIRPEDEMINEFSSEDTKDVNKRGYNRGFLRFGRNRNFLRFGKRDGFVEHPASSSETSESVLDNRPVRAPTRNFIRFG
ncbi:FMRFamide neuropeptides-like [Cherax quadricarinatus]|uniref:FMRFamide neuropeptides-like n=1 Tax=Cherax quadricarinatus TaxID=27406 RepID=UPI00387E9462